MKRALLFVAGIVATLAPGSAAADSFTPAVANCNGSSLVSAHHVTGGGHNYGAVQLCRRGSKYFAIYINYNASGTAQGPMPSGRWATAWLLRFTNGAYDGGNWSCDSPLPNANERVRPGDTWCIGPEIDGSNTNVTFQAFGNYYIDPSTRVAYGETAVTR